MNTRILMTSSAIFLGITGMFLSFFPHEIAAFLGISSNLISILLLQVLSAFFMGFGILNWMAKDARIGGIYNKPIAIGNLMHFGVGTIALLKMIFGISTNTHPEIIISLTVVYTIFSLGFAFVFMNNPK